jgi:hypothetical protein
MIRTVIGILAALVLGNIVYATFLWKKPPPDRAAQIANAAMARGEEPWANREKYAEPGRKIIRKSIMKTLERPWSDFCTDAGGKNLVDSLNHYYGQRNAQLASYGNGYGEAGRRHVIKAWSTIDDGRIERLIREHYGRGYIRPDRLSGPARKAIGELVKGDAVTGKPCG